MRSILYFKFKILLGGFCLFLSFNSLIAQSSKYPLYFQEIYDSLSTELTPTQALLATIEKQKMGGLSELQTSKYINFLFSKRNEIQSKHSIDFAELSYKIARILDLKGQKYKAYELIDNVSTILSDKNLKVIDFANKYLQLKGEILYNFGQYKEAGSYLRKAIQLTDKESVLKISCYNTLGLVYREAKQKDSTIYYFNKALGLAKESNNEAWKGIIIGNLGYSHFVKGDYKKAMIFLETDKKISLEHHEEGSALNAVATIIEIRLKQKKLKYIKEDIKLLDSLSALILSPLSLRSYYRVKTLYWEEKNNYKNAFESFKLWMKFADSVRVSHSAITFENMQFQFEFEKRKAERRLLLEKQKRNNLFYISSFIVFLIVLVACLLIIYQLRKRRRNEKKMLQLKNEKIQYQLDRNKDKLSKLLKNISHKNDMIETLNKEIKKKDKIVDSTLIAKEKNELKHEIHSITILTEKDLVEFKQLFNKIYPGLYDEIKKRHPDLSKAEERMIMLIRLNLSTFEMAKILGISEDSVRKANLRVRKKLNFDTQDKLVTYIHSV